MPRCWAGLWVALCLAASCASAEAAAAWSTADGTTHTWTQGGQTGEADNDTLCTYGDESRSVPSLLRGRSRCFVPCDAAGVHAPSAAPSSPSAALLMALLESGGKAALATRPPWVEKAGDAADFVVSPLVYVGPGVSFASGAAGVHWNVTLATHLSAERLPHLLRLCENWKGPVTAVVFVPGSGRAVRRLLHTVGKWGSAAASLALHLVQPVGLELAQEAVYPINLMRAIAQRLAQTPWVLVIDADLHLTHEAAHFSAALAEAEADLQAGEAHVPGFRGLDMDDFLAGARNPHAHVAPCKGLHAFVVIALEASMDVTRVPAPPSHAEIWQAVASGAIGPMHPYFPRAYMPANYRRWLSERGRVAFTVPFAPSFEPYLIVPRAAPAPDPAFVDRGMNKAQWTAHLFAAGYSFTVLPHVSVVDVPTSVGRQRPHMPSVLPAWDSAASHVLGTYGVKTYRPFGWQALDEEILQSARRLPAWSSFLSAVTVLVEGRRVQRGVQSAVPRAGDALRAPGGVVLVLQLCVRSQEMRSLLQHYCSMPSISQIVAVAACPQQMIEPAVEACPLGQPLHIVDQAQAGVPRFSFRGLPPLQCVLRVLRCAKLNRACSMH